MSLINNQRKLIVVVILGIISYIFLENHKSFYSGAEFRAHLQSFYSRAFGYFNDDNKLNETNAITENCWEEIIRRNKNNDLAVSPDTMLCLFEPIDDMSYRRYDKKTVVIGLGVHLGPAAEAKHSVQFSDIEYISWEYRDKNYKGAHNYLIHGFDAAHLLRTQKLFWDKYCNDTDLKRADIIVCGFDVWHCLIFAPFNKKLVLNSNYRFDGHIGINGPNQIELQKRLYEAVRYNPDVIISGGIVYDVAYSQHFLGSHKIIPLPADGRYVLKRLEGEIKQKNLKTCKGVPNNTTGYHPILPPTIMIGPKRLSQGGKKVANEIYQYFQNKSGKYKVQIMERHMKQPYNYCDLGKYSAIIVLGYSVMSYFTLECAALGIPMFIPTPRLYAEWEKKYHLIQERKGPLQQTAFNNMKQNSRSLNYGYNPNDDFKLKDLERWVSYSDYYYYKGHMQFDSYEDLYKILENADIKKMHKNMFQHTQDNGLRYTSHWKSIDRYFHGNAKTDFVRLPSEMPATLNEGFNLWNKKIKRPSFDQNSKLNEIPKSQTIVIIDFDVYMKEFDALPDCRLLKQEKIIFFRQGARNIEIKKGCEIHDVGYTVKYLPEQFKSLNFETSSKKAFLITMIYVTTNNATKLILLEKEGCILDSKLMQLVQFSDLWKQRTLLPKQYFSAWLPFDKDIAKLWLRAVSKFTDDTTLQNCMAIGFYTVPYPTKEINRLQDYLKHWITDEIENFFHMLDQLNFELSVRGFISKSDALLYRYFLEHLVSYIIATVPKLKKIA